MDSATICSVNANEMVNNSPKIMIIAPRPFPALANPPNAPITTLIPPIAIPMFAILLAKLPILSGTFLSISPIACAINHNAPPEPIKDKTPTNSFSIPTISVNLPIPALSPAIVDIVPIKVISLGVNDSILSGIALSISSNAFA